MSAQQNVVEKILLSYPTFRKLNVRSVCTKLVSGQSVLAETFPSVTVYFGDIVGFTAMSSKMSAKELVKTLNALFANFDKLAEVSLASKDGAIWGNFKNKW